jgi:hypothetical protein
MSLGTRFGGVQDCCTVYFARSNTLGWNRYDRYPFTIGVLGAPDNFMAIGRASEVGRDAEGSALWSLIVHGVRVPGRWVIIDRRFVPLDDCPAGGRSRSR